MIAFITITKSLSFKKAGGNGWEHLEKGLLPLFPSAMIVDSSSLVILVLPKHLFTSFIKQAAESPCLM